MDKFCKENVPDSALGATKKTGVTNQKNCDACFVEIDGFEPTTLCLQSRCSSQLSYTPLVCFERLPRWTSIIQILTTGWLLRFDFLVRLASISKQIQGDLAHSEISAALDFDNSNPHNRKVAVV